MYTLIKQEVLAKKLIIGLSGAGKTLFTRNLVKSLWDEVKLDQPHVLSLWVPLLSIENSEKHLLAKHLRENLYLNENEIKRIVEGTMPLFLVYDGYDELIHRRIYISKINLM